MENNSENSNSSNGEHENANSQNGGQHDYESMDAGALKAMLKERERMFFELESKNRQLFERAKAAEGFKKTEDGSWIKEEKPKPKNESKAEKSDDKLLERLDRMTLRASQITEQDEVQLAVKWRERTGMDLEEILSDDIFQAKLKDLRDKKSIEKTLNGINRGGGGTSEAKNTPEYWIAKGTPPSPDQVSDRKTRAKIVRAMMASAKTGGKKFYND